MPNGACALAWSAIGGLLAGFSRSLIDVQMLESCSFEPYVPYDIGMTEDQPVEEIAASTLVTPASRSAQERAALPPFMTLDVHALRNLEIFENSYDGTVRGSLNNFLNKCCTPFGRRLFRAWLSKPLCVPSTIEKRLDAVEDLMQLQEAVQDLRPRMAKLPDLDKLCISVHALGSKYLATEHAMARAVMYMEETYTLRKIRDFHTVLSGFSEAQSMMQDFIAEVRGSGADLRSETLRMLLGIGGASKDAAAFSWPDLTETLNALLEIALPRPGNGSSAKAHFRPRPGINPLYDEALQEDRSIRRDLKQFPRPPGRSSGQQTSSTLGRRRTRGRSRSRVAAGAPDSWTFSSKKKGAKRSTRPGCRT